MTRTKKENPYTPNRPATLEVFVGRAKLRRQLSKDLLTGRCFELTGGPGIGKTSLLMAVQREILAQQSKARRGPVPLSLRVECRRTHLNAEAILTDITLGLAEALNGQRRLVCPITVLNKAQMEAERGQLEAALNALLEWAFACESCTHLPIVLLDDLHRLSDRACLQPLASILNTSVDRQQIGLALASQQPLAGELRDDVSLLRMLISQHHHLEPLSLDETRALVEIAAEYGWKVEQGCGELAHQLTDGHPYRLHYYLYGALSNEQKLTIAGLQALHTPATVLHLDKIVANQAAALSPKTKPLVFVSYSHLDEAEKNKVLSHLGVLGNAAELIDVWSDDRIGAGADWEREIEKTIAQARVAILLVTDHFLSSKFISDKEVPALLQRRNRDGLIVYPVIAKDCAWKAVTWLAAMNVKPKNGVSVWRDAGRYVDEELVPCQIEIDGCSATK